MSAIAGVHVPGIPFAEVFGNVGTLPPEQMLRLVPKLKDGRIFGLTVNVKVAGVAHRPAVGVKV